MKIAKFFLLIIMIFFTVQFAAAQFESIKASSSKIHKNTTPMPVFSGHNIKVKNGLLVENLISKPGNSIDYVWDEDNHEWIHYTNTTYSYDDSGRLLEEVAIKVASGTNDTRFKHLYDEFGNLTEKSFYIWNGVDWTQFEGEKYLYNYDSEGKLTEKTSQYWNVNQWVNDLKEVYEYNGNNEPILIVNFTWIENAWQSDSKYMDLVWYNWPEKQMKSYIMQYKYEGDIWLNAERLDATYNGNTVIEIYETWTGTEWNDFKKDTYLDTETEMVYTIEYFESGQWVYYEKYISGKDEHGNEVGFAYEYWDVNDWVTVFAYGFIYSYNSNNDITETIIQYWEPTFSEPLNIARYLYSNFQYFVTGQNENMNDIGLLVYPNPATNFVRIETNDKRDEINLVEIVNLSGQVVYSNMASNISLVDVSSLSEGLYLFTCKSSSGKLFRSKLVKK